MQPTGIMFYQDDAFPDLFSFGLRYIIDDTNCALNEHVSKGVSVMESVLKKAIASLFANLNDEFLSTLFEFPEHLRTSCKQYLIYFVQFLADLGYEAETELKEDANKTLFKITPKDGKEALTNIREALAIYLNAPGSPDFDGSSFKVM